MARTVEEIQEIVTFDLHREFTRDEFAGRTVEDGYFSVVDTHDEIRGGLYVPPQTGRLAVVESGVVVAVYGSDDDGEDTERLIKYAKANGDVCTETIARALFYIANPGEAAASRSQDSLMEVWNRQRRW